MKGAGMPPDKREILARLRQVPNPTPAKLLAAFRRLVAEAEALAKAIQ